MFGNRPFKRQTEQTEPPECLRVSTQGDLTARASFPRRQPCPQPKYSAPHARERTSLSTGCSPTLSHFHGEPQPTVRLTPEDVITPSCRHKAKAQGWLPEMGAETLAPARARGSTRSNHRSPRVGVATSFPTPFPDAPNDSASLTSWPSTQRATLDPSSFSGGCWTVSGKVKGCQLLEGRREFPEHSEGCAGDP